MEDDVLKKLDPLEISEAELKELAKPFDPSNPEDMLIAMKMVTTIALH